MLLLILIVLNIFCNVVPQKKKKKKLGEVDNILYIIHIIIYIVCVCISYYAT